MLILGGLSENLIFSRGGVASNAGWVDVIVIVVVDDNFVD